MHQNIVTVNSAIESETTVVISEYLTAQADLVHQLLTALSVVQVQALQCADELSQSIGIEALNKVANAVAELRADLSMAITTDPVEITAAVTLDNSQSIIKHIKVDAVKDEKFVDIIPTQYSDPDQTLIDEYEKEPETTVTQIKPSVEVENQKQSHEINILGEQNTKDEHVSLSEVAELDFAESVATKESLLKESDNMTENNDNEAIAHDVVEDDKFSTTDYDPESVTTVTQVAATVMKTEVEITEKMSLQSEGSKESMHPLMEMKANAAELMVAEEKPMQKDREKAGKLIHLENLFDAYQTVTEKNDTDTAIAENTIKAVLDVIDATEIECVSFNVNLREEVRIAEVIEPPITEQGSNEQQELKTTTGKVIVLFR